MSDLRRSIVIVNEFSVKQPDGSGSRGATPGSYVERYMARPDAVETLAPIQRARTDDFILRYMARADAVEAAPSIGEAKTTMKRAQGLGGVAFGYGSISLSDEELVAASRDIQRMFDDGKTVMKTVLSFDEEYLRDNGIIDEDFHCRTAGDYRGHIDQMKMRMAIMEGMKRMAAGTANFDDLRYVATIQVDTEHVHAHISAVDAGTGFVMPDGTQRGKLLDRHKSRLRRGIDAYLDEKQAVARLSSAVGYERRNVTTFIKRWAHRTMQEESLPQFLLACLPEDRRLWRAGSNDTRMRRPNELITEMVTEQLERPGSPMPQARAAIIDYANTRREKEGLDEAAWQRLIDNGQQRVVDRAVNGVYGMLRALPEDELRIRTPMLEVMSMDDAQLAQMAETSRTKTEASEDLIGFGFRLRSYTSRLRHHREQTSKYRELSRSWEAADRVGAALPESRPVYDFYRFEAEYNRALTGKYRHFLPMLGDESEFDTDVEEVSDYGQRLLALISLRGDTSLQRMKDFDEAERLGRMIYDQPGGGQLTRGSVGRSVLDSRIDAMRDRHGQMLGALRTDLSDAGLSLRPATPEEIAAGRKAQVIEPMGDEEFGEVKALDLHHLGYDFFTDVEISQRAAKSFNSAASRRRGLLLGAMSYLDESGQSETISQLPVEDVAAMNRLSARMRPDEQGKLWLPSRYTELREQERAEKVRRSAASSLDSGLVLKVRDRVDEAVLEGLPEQEPVPTERDSLELGRS